MLENVGPSLTGFGHLKPSRIKKTIKVMTKKELTLETS